MNNRQIEKTIRDILSDQLSVDRERLTADAKLSDLGADSLDAVEIVMKIEDEFKLSEIPDRKLADFRTVGDIFEYVKQTLK